MRFGLLFSSAFTFQPYYWFKKVVFGYSGFIPFWLSSLVLVEVFLHPKKLCLTYCLSHMKLTFLSQYLNSLQIFVFVCCLQLGCMCFRLELTSTLLSVQQLSLLHVSSFFTRPIHRMPSSCFYYHCLQLFFNTFLIDGNLICHSRFSSCSASRKASGSGVQLKGQW